MTVSIRYITLYVGGVPVQVVEGGSLHLIFAGLGATTVPGVPAPGARPDPFPYYVNEDELAAAGIGTSDASVAALVGDDASQTGVALRAAFDAWGGDGSDLGWHNVRDYGAVGSGSVDDTAAFDGATDAIRTAGGGVLYVPPGFYLVDQIRMVSRMSIIGAGWSSRLRQNVVDGHLIVLDTPSTEWTRVSDLWLDGHSEAQVTANDAIHYDNTGGTFSFFDTVHRLDNLLVYTPSGNGIYVSADCRETRASDIFITGADGYGFYLQGTDCFYVNCTAAASGKHGFFALGNNSKFTNCKAFGNGRLAIPNEGDGFHVLQSHQAFVNCEAQDNGRNGFTVYNTNDVTLTACIADSNGNREYAVGFRFDSVSRLHAHALIAKNRDAFTSQKWGASISGLTNAQVSLLTASNADGELTGSTVGVHLILNGEEILTSAGGTRYRLTIGNDGALTTTAL